MLREARVDEYLLQGQRAAGYVRRVLEENPVASGNRGDREPHHLPDRVVPRHHCQHEADCLIAHPGFDIGDLNLLVAQDRRGLVCVVLGGDGRLLQLIFRLTKRLAHLCGDQLREGTFLLPKDIGQPPHSRHPSLKQLLAPGFCGRGAGGYGLLNLLGSRRLVPG